MRKVLIGTPCYDGKVDVWFANSLLETIKMSYEKDVFVHAVYVAMIHWFKEPETACLI